MRQLKAGFDLFACAVWSNDGDAGQKWLWVPVGRDKHESFGNQHQAASTDDEAVFDFKQEVI